MDMKVLEACYIVLLWVCTDFRKPKNLGVEIDNLGHASLAILPELGFMEQICVARKVRTKGSPGRGKGSKRSKIYKDLKAPCLKGSTGKSVWLWGWPEPKLEHIYRYQSGFVRLRSACHFPVTVAKQLKQTGWKFETFILTLNGRGFSQLVSLFGVYSDTWDFGLVQLVSKAAHLKVTGKQKEREEVGRVSISPSKECPNNLTYFYQPTF